MQNIAGWINGRSAPDREPDQKASLVAEWKTYSTGVETKVSNGQTDAAVMSAEEGTSKVGSIVSGAFNTMASAASSAAISVTTSAQSVPGTTQWVYFGAFAAAGVIFMSLSFFIFLPMIILSPSKFAVTFSIGSLCIICSLGALRGWKQMASVLIAWERLPFTAAYFGSLFATLYAALVMHSYLISLLSCVAQVGALVYYLLSFFPGGHSGLAAMSSGARSLGTTVISSMFRS